MNIIVSSAAAIMTIRHDNPTLPESHSAGHTAVVAKCLLDPECPSSRPEVLVK